MQRHTHGLETLVLAEVAEHLEKVETGKEVSTVAARVKAAVGKEAPAVAARPRVVMAAAAAAAEVLSLLSALRCPLEKFCP
jgi:hypothetical protein